MVDYSITVLVPTYNHARYIVDAVESVKRQSLFDQCLLIVSDDSSTDETFDLAGKTVRGHRNIRLRRNAVNLGTMPHYKSLVENVDTPFTAILEGDDVWLNDRRLESLRDMLTRNVGMPMCFTACVIDYEGTGKRINHPAWNDGRNRLINIIDFIQDNPVATFSNCLYRTSDLKRVIRDPNSAAGYDWLCNMQIALGNDIGFVGDPGTLYRVHRFGQWSRLPENERVVKRRQTLDALLRRAPPDLHAFIHAAIRRMQ
jgi:glycosyltransferase involved in cell wall biosynthesis